MHATVPVQSKMQQRRRREAGGMIEGRGRITPALQLATGDQRQLGRTSPAPANFKCKRIWATRALLPGRARETRVPPRARARTSTSEGGRREGGERRKRRKSAVSTRLCLFLEKGCGLRPALHLVDIRQRPDPRNPPRLCHAWANRTQFVVAAPFGVCEPLPGRGCQEEEAHGPRARQDAWPFQSAR